MRKRTAGRAPPTPKQRIAANGHVLVRSEGQRLLMLVPGSLADIADVTRAKSRQSPLNWRNGVSIPDTGQRAALWGAYAIPALAWSQPPIDSRAEPTPPVGGNGHPPPPAAPADTGPPPTTLESCLRLLGKIRQESERELLPGERVKLADTEARILTLRHKLELEASLSEDRIIREHPRWAHVRRAILGALVGHPAASKAVCDALAAISQL